MESAGCEKCTTRDCRQCVLVTEAAKEAAARMQLVITVLEPGLIRAQLLDHTGEEWDSHLVSRIVMRAGKAIYEKPSG